MAQTYSNEELCNLLLQGLVAKDEKLIKQVLDCEDDQVITEVINKLPVHHVRKLVIEISNLLSNEISINHLKWLQQLITLKYSVISSMPDGRSIFLPLVTLLDDRSSPEYYNKLQSLKAKLTLVKQLRHAQQT